MDMERKNLHADTIAKNGRMFGNASYTGYNFTGTNGKGTIKKSVFTP